MTESTEEARKRFENKLGKEFGELFYFTRIEWSNTWVLWRQYKNLFVYGGDERIKLLNECGSQFFRMVQDRFLEATLLGLCRLSDPAKSAGQKTVTVRSFFQFMDNKERKQKIRILTDDIGIKTEFARDWRNNFISHSNYEFTTNTTVKKPTASIKEVNDAITAFYSIFQYVGSEFMDSDLKDWVRTPLNDEMATIQMLFHGRATWEENREKSRLGIQAMKREPDWVVKRCD